MAPLREDDAEQVSAMDPDCLLDTNIAPLGMQLGFVRLDFADTVATARSWMAGNSVPMEWSNVSGADVADGLLQAFPYVCTPFDRTAFAAISPNWTLLAGNSAIGGDVTSCLFSVSRIAKVTAILASWTPARERMFPSAAYSRIVDGAVVRSIHLGREGKWQLSESGAPLPFEEVATYATARGAKKLTREMVLRYLAADGVTFSSANAPLALTVVRDTSPWAVAVPKTPLAAKRAELHLDLPTK